MPTGRRDFLKFSASALASYFTLPAARKTFAASVDPLDSDRVAFPQGVASADPQPNAIILWTRVEPLPDEQKTPVVLQISLTNKFEEMLLEQTLITTTESDFTIRAMIHELEPDTTYYYRFIAPDGAVSRVGRTWTAPPPDAKRPVMIALASCQSWPPSRYGAYRRLIQDDQMADKDSGIDLILHVGDYVYGLPANPDEPVEPGQAGGTGRGGRSSSDAQENAPENFDSYLSGHRQIYKTYLTDPDLQDARALYPFVAIWDDHEYGNDVWQSYTNGRANPEKRAAATQAWFEFVPQILTGSLSVPGVPNEARDYRKPSSIAYAPMTNFGEGFLSEEQNNLAAIRSQTCYRTIRWGANVDLVITDNRSYRGPSANPGYSVTNLEAESSRVNVFSGFSLFEGETLYTLSQGRKANEGSPPETVTVNGEEIQNPRATDPAISLLGTQQKRWFKEVMTKSSAAWKVWANAEPITGFYFDAGRVNPEAGSGFLWTDSWDGFPNEREELMRFIKENRISNVVSLSGDRHAHYAGLVAENYNAETPNYVIPEFACAAISAFARAPFLARTLRRFGLSHLAMYERENNNGEKESVSNLNLFMRKGARAAEEMVKTNDLTQALSAADPAPNPHLAYADNDVHGYCLCRFDADRCDTDFIAVARPNWDPDEHPEGPPILRTVGYQVNAWEGGETPELMRKYTRGETIFGEG